MAILAGTAGLLFVLSFRLYRFFDGFPVGDLGICINNLCAIPVFQPGTDNVQMDVRYAGQGELLGFCIVHIPQGGILFQQPCNPCGNFVLVPFGFS